MPRKIQPLNEVLEKIFSDTGNRRKSALKIVTVHRLVRGTIHNKRLASIQDILRHTVKLAFSKVSHAVYVFTDASEDFSAGLGTQTDKKELGKNVDMQKHEPMPFLGGRFAGAQRNWTTYDKEASTTIQSFDRMDYLF